jgi:hypothetical protein
MKHGPPSVEQLSLLLAADTPQATERLCSLLASLPPDEASNLLDDVIYENPIDPQKQSDDVFMLVPFLFLAAPVLIVLLFLLGPLMIGAVPFAVYGLCVSGSVQTRRNRRMIGLRAARIMASMDDERAIDHLATAWGEWHRGKLAPEPSMGRHEIEAELIRLMERHTARKKKAPSEAIQRLLTEALSETRLQQNNGSDIREELADLILTTMRFLVQSTSSDRAAFNLIEGFADLPQGDPSGNTAVVRDAAYGLNQRWNGTAESAAQPAVLGLP